MTGGWVIIVERKSFDLEITYAGNAKVLCITERRKGSYVAAIRFRALLIPWLCTILDQACREANPGLFYRSKDDGNKVIIVQGGANQQGKFLKISELLRNGKEYRVFIPGDTECSGGSIWHSYFEDLSWRRK